MPFAEAQKLPIALQQVRAALREVRRVGVLVRSEAVPAQRKRVADRFEIELGSHEQSLVRLEKAIEDGQQIDLTWTELRGIRIRANTLYRELLAFLHGASLRAMRLDDGLCTLADAMLDDLSHRTKITWSGFTVLAWEGESYMDLAELVRLRFPDVSIWNLPVAAHEFGHFVEAQLTETSAEGVVRRPVVEWINSRTGVFGVEHARELFADVFASYTAGPAYAATCTLLRFDPTAAFTDMSSHPSPAKRIHVILKQLERADAPRFVRLYSNIVTQLREIWRQTLLSAGNTTTELNAVTEQQLDSDVDQIFNMLSLLTPAGVQYPGWLRAQNLASELNPDGESKANLQQGDTIIDVLNAAWLSRLSQMQDNPDRIRSIGNRSSELCRQLLAGG